MAFIQWKDELSVGDLLIDTDHKRMINLIEKLHDAYTAGKSNEVLETLLYDMLNYTMGHFEREEKFMNKISYFDTEAHKQEHDKLTAKVQELHHNFKAGQTSLDDEVMFFMRDWLFDHIMKTDKKLAAFAMSGGASMTI